MIKINELQLENVKRIKAVKLEPAQNGLTVIGGKNGQGKTSVIDSIAWALGGDKYRPSEPQRTGSVIPPILHIELSNGLIVERKGKNSALKVIDPNGNKGGQQLLNEFIEQFALDLPKFMQGTSKEKAEILLQVIGVGEQLYEIENREIYFSTEHKGDYSIIKCKNKITDSVLSKNPLLQTDKADKKNHGKGITIVKSIAQKYGGDVVVSEKNNEFIVSVILDNRNLPENC